MIHNGQMGYYLKSALIIFVVTTFCLSPLFFWYYALPFEYRFSSTSSTLMSIGKMTGLVGIAAFSFTLILSARLKLLEKLFEGLNIVYIFHHLLGAIALILLLIHPIVLAFPYRYDFAAKFSFTNLGEAALFFLPGADWTINIGIASLFLMMALLILTFFTILRYQLWRFFHKFLGLVFFFAGLHSFFVASDIARFAPLQNYMILIWFLGFGAFLYRTVFGRFFIKRYSYNVKHINLVGEQTYEIILNPKGENMFYYPGQFVFISFIQPGFSKEVHPFSISSAPDEYGELMVTAKTEGDYTSTFNMLQIGVTAVVEGPFGNFLYHKAKYKNQVWIAGGIGIAPFVGMARSLPQGYNIDLYYCMHDEQEDVYINELNEIATQKPFIKFIPYYSASQGRLTAEIINKTSNSLIEKSIFICGPPPMMKSLLTQLHQIKVKDKDINFEAFQM